MWDTNDGLCPLLCIWLVSYTHDDLGFIDLEQRTYNHSTTRSARGCHPCLRNNPSPMSPRQALNLLVPGEGFEPLACCLQNSNERGMALIDSCKRIQRVIGNGVDSYHRRMPANDGGNRSGGWLSRRRQAVPVGARKSARSLSGRRKRGESRYIWTSDVSRVISRPCDTHMETVHTVVSPSPMTWRIAVTGGIVTAIMAVASAVGMGIARSTTASFVCSPWP